ncbi:MAG: hypothetical protein WBC33_07440 [Conexibacter sp.]
MLALAALAPGAAAADPRFSGQVTDALRTPTHRLLANAQSGRAVADLVFVDRQQAGTSVRTCVRRLDVEDVRTCFADATGAAGAASVTPLRFARGRYRVRWRVAGELVAEWRFKVV